MEANKITKVYPYEVLIGKNIPKDVILHRKEVILNYKIIIKHAKL